MNFNTVLKNVLVAGILGALFIPFVVSDSQLFPFISGKGFVFRILVEILFAVWMVGMFRDSSLRPRFSWVMGSVLLFVGIIALADITGVSFYKSFWSNYERMDGLISILHLLLYFIVVGSVLDTRAKWQLFFNSSVVVSVVMSFYVFFQLAGKIVINQGGVRVDATFGNAAYLAVYMLFNFFITLLLLFRAYQENKNAVKNGNRALRNGVGGTNWYLMGWYGLAALFQVIVIYYTATRGVILGLIGGLVVSSVIVALFEKDRPAIRKIALGGLAGIIILFGAFFALRTSSFVTHSPTLSRFSSLSVQDFNTEGRRYVWPMAVKGFLERPILGWGQENFNYVFNKYYDPRMYNLEPWFDRAHNIVLDWLVAGGALGLLSYLGMFAVLVALTLKSKNFSFTEKSILLGLVAAYFFQNLFVFDNLISYFFFFTILAFVHFDGVQGKTTPAWISKMTSNATVSKMVIPGVVGVLAVVGIYFLNVKPILASQGIISSLNALAGNPPSPQQSLDDLNRAFNYKTFGDGEASEQAIAIVYKLFENNVDAGIKKQFADLAVQHMGAVSDHFKNDARYSLFMGSLESRVGDPKNALVYLARAHESSPKKQKIIQEMGLAYLSLKDYPKALEQFKAAYDLAPEYDESIRLYAIGALYAKDTKLANQLFAKIGEDNSAYDERIVAAYADTGNLAEAVRLIQKRSDVHPEDATLRFRLAAGYLGLGQRAHAVQILQDVAVKFPAYKDQADYYTKEIQAGRNP